jgi:hypothetical protein
MKRLLAFALFSLLASLAAAPAIAGGINLSWDDCGSHGIPMKAFLCNTNVGSDFLIASVVPPVTLYQVVAMEAIVDVSIADPVVPSWWDFTSTTGCRSNRLTVSMDFTAGPFGCADPWLGQAVGGINYQLTPNGPGSARIRMVAAVPSNLAFAMDDTTEYYAFRIAISHQKTVGTGACPGCDVGACLLFSRLQLDQPAGVGDFVVEQPQSRLDASWQCPGFVGTTPYGQFCVLTCPVPVKSKTWGGVKSLYR